MGDMAINQSRSMNSDLRRGSVDGRTRFLRPNAGTATGAISDSESAARDRADLLHPIFYGTFGIESNDARRIDASLPAAVRPGPVGP